MCAAALMGMSVRSFLINTILGIDRCSIKGHTVNKTTIKNLKTGTTITTNCAICGDPLIVSIDPDDNERYVWREEY